MLRALTCVASVAAMSLSVPDGEVRWVDRNDVDWEACHSDQVLAQSAMLNVLLEEGGKFHPHTAYLYRCDVECNELYIRLSGSDAHHSQLLRFSWPDVLDETYLFHTKVETGDKDDIDYGFRVPVASSTNKRFHFRRFMFDDLPAFNRFLSATSQLTNGEYAHKKKFDFFKAPMYRVEKAAVDDAMQEDGEEELAMAVGYMGDEGNDEERESIETTEGNDEETTEEETTEEDVTPMTF